MYEAIDYCPVCGSDRVVMPDRLDADDFEACCLVCEAVWDVLDVEE